MEMIYTLCEGVNANVPNAKENLIYYIGLIILIIIPLGLYMKQSRIVHGKKTNTLHDPYENKKNDF